MIRIRKQTQQDQAARSREFDESLQERFHEYDMWQRTALLWAHLVSQHGVVLDPLVEEYQLGRIHDHRHRSVCDHNDESRDYSLAGIRRTLVSAGEEEICEDE